MKYITTSVQLSKRKCRKEREYHLHGWVNLQMSVRLFPGGLSNIKVHLKFNFSCAIALYGLEEKRCCFKVDFLFVKKIRLKLLLLVIFYFRKGPKNK